jgi:predicted permease
MNRSVCRVMMGVAGLAVLGMTAALVGAQTDGAMAQAPDAGCALPSEPEGIPAAKRGIGSLILRGSMLNPIVVAIVLGAALAGTGLALPEAITRFLGFLGGAAGPAALFALGGASLCSVSTAEPPLPRA